MTEKTCRIRPLNDHIVVERCEVQEHPNKMMLVIPDVAKKAPVEGVILAVGPGPRRADGSRRPLDCRVGDRILFDKYVMNEVRVDDREVAVMQEADIVVVLDEGAAIR